MEHALPQAEIIERDFEDIDKSHVAWFVRFMSGVATSRNSQFYSILQREFPGETLRMAFELRQILRKMDPKDTKVYTWESRILEHLEDRPAQGDSG